MIAQGRPAVPQRTASDGFSPHGQQTVVPPPVVESAAPALEEQVI